MNLANEGSISRAERHKTFMEAYTSITSLGKRDPGAMTVSHWCLCQCRWQEHQLNPPKLCHHRHRANRLQSLGRVAVRCGDSG